MRRGRRDINGVGRRPLPVATHVCQPGKICVHVGQPGRLPRLQEPHLVQPLLHLERRLKQGKSLHEFS